MTVNRKIAGLVLALVATTAAVAALETPAQADGDYYRIVNIGSGLCAQLDPAANPYNYGDAVVQEPCDTAQPTQYWHPVSVGGGVYEFANKVSAACLDVRDGRNADGTPVQQWGCTGTTSMKWTINPSSFTGVHQIISKIGSRCLDVAAGSTTPGARIQIYHCTGFGNAAQVWSFER